MIMIKEAHEKALVQKLRETEEVLKKKRISGIVFDSVDLILEPP